MKKYFFTIFSFAIIHFSFGQNSFKKNDIYLEAGGAGLFGSVNYERQLTKEPGLGNGGYPWIGVSVDKRF